jgi:vacuolar-type H+-ATPase subunit C/Vma6
MGLSFAWPFLNLRAEAAGAETFQMELALDQWYYQEARQTLRSETGMVDPLSHALALEADLTNVLTVLRFAQDPHERDLLRDRFGTDEIEVLFIAAGRIPYELLLNAYRQDTVTAAVESLSGTFLEAALRAGLEAYSRSNRLSDIERQLKRYRLVWMAEQITKDPLGIGVVLGYLALKINEVSNIRWTTQGISLRLRPDAIRAELEMVS